MDEEYLALDIGGTKIGIAIGKGDGTIESKVQFPTPHSSSEAIAIIESEAKKLMASSSPKALGISCGGPLDAKRGVILSPPHLKGWENTEICRILSSSLGIPSALQNDANACALAEHMWGAGKGVSDMVFITCGTGFGAGLILGGELYEGKSSMAGEIGHVFLDSDGPVCYGKKGSAEAFCSGEGISLLHEMRGRGKLSAKSICALAEEGDEGALLTTNESARRLGSILSVIIDILNPEKIIIGSIYSRHERLFRETALEIVEREALEYSSSVCSVEPSLLGDDIGYKAALGVARNRI